MNAAYTAARLQQIDWMMHRLNVAKEVESHRRLYNPLSGRPLHERAALYILRRRGEINDTLERLSDERNNLGGVA